MSTYVDRLCATLTAEIPDGFTIMCNADQVVIEHPSGARAFVYGPEHGASGRELLDAPNAAIADVVQRLATEHGVPDHL